MWIDFELSQHLDRKSNSKYARCLFIDYSSAFNTMQPHTLINRLAEYNIPARLQLFVLDFLTDRKQYVRTEIELSSTTSINTGARQGCVLSAFLFIIYTNALSLCSTTCKIIKYADDTVVIGLINNDNEQEYRDTVSYVSSRGNENHLNLNAGKTKEMIFDFRKIQNDKAPIIINNTSVKQVPSYKYLGLIIQNNLKWNEHVTAQVKKADQRMYHVRRLSKLKIDNEILCLSIILLCRVFWFMLYHVGLTCVIKSRKKKYANLPREWRQWQVIVIKLKIPEWYLLKNVNPWSLKWLKMIPILSTHT